MALPLMNRVRVDPRADPPRPSANQAVVGAIYRAFGFVAQPSRGLKKPIEEISRGGDESPSKPPRSSRGGGLGMIQRRQQPRGVGWGNYVIAWLLTYSGSDCELWRLVLEKCMESELCREAMSLLPTIGYDLRRHKCVEDREDLDVVVTQPPNSTSKPTNTTPNNHPNPRSKLLPKLLNCLVNPQNNPELLPGSWVGLPPTPPS